MTQPSYDARLVEAELRARAAYAEPGRHYHDERHLEDCLARLAAVSALDEHERRLLRWAILWHDSVYDPERGDNEVLSAGLAREELLDCGVSQADADEVSRLILLTRGHRTGAGDRLGALMVSIDLATLGADRERYARYAADVRREYAHLSDAQWAPGRATVLQSLLAREPIFPEPSFRAALESRARRNIEEELSGLRPTGAP